MKKFSDLSIAFNKWRVNNNIPYSVSDLARYIWSLPESAVEVWKSELDPYSDFISESNIRIYKSMFDPGSRLLGISNADAYTSSTLVRLYKLTEVRGTFSVKDMLNSSRSSLINKSRTFQLPSGESVTIPVIIKPNSVVINSGFSGTDSRINYRTGIVSSADAKRGIVQDNYNSGNSVYGLVDYTNGEFQLVRNNPDNDDKFPKYYDDLVKMVKESSSSEKKPESSPQKEVPPNYEYRSLSGEFIYFDNPIELAFEFEVGE